ncbi:GNAT family N-acetyltransferase [Legionella oakridgensis]|uniref:Acetyltransferase, including N-acetylases of ribosomal protein n=2 Tax=Legionella oakridgensis TaxID=29423 RepID=W0BGP2_9GAMM|nr:GNAT family N-acetyltransferase [Legionella oakridgensis]AHE67604.1 acetyltransferase, including N-acetylases of ribosomal protein [Legionella oakridgensis ATCC 33761 = DSM 21215]ETO92843.1 acetyltransferase, including N-acetylase of ribosomal protein [Legionella oakridgensis RV-2-2007]KTD37050.1 acetyltransferase [Legionella oakridgensis]STY20641.1 acetyltransferase [Legionella longbeachae]
MNILETKRLILRTWEDKDLDAMTAIDQDPKVCQYLPGIGNREETSARIQRCINHYHEKDYTLYAVELKNTHDMIGFLGLMTPSFEAHFTPAVEIGWRLSSKQWNQGYATEGAKAVLHDAFTRLNLDEIVSFTVVNNMASRKVMEKIGMHHDPNDDFDHPKLDKNSPLRRHVLYRLTKADYFKKNPSQMEDLTY